MALKSIPTGMHIGSIHASKRCGNFEVIEYNGYANITVKFLLTGAIVVTSSSSVRNGCVRDVMCPSVYGVGFVGNGPHIATKRKVATKKYQTWKGMMERCYCPKLKVARPTYNGCTVCDEWHNFQVFAEWFDGNYIEGYHLDKDIKVKGNKIYSPDTCLFVSQAENTIDASAKLFKFTSPNGDGVSIYNLRAFCAENGLCDKNMHAVYSSKRRSHKGWTKA